ncbi:MAG: glycosyltransferase family A protein [Candidatus Aminicenantes bacterium]
MKNNMPKVSCLMVTANRKHLLRRSLLCYKNQTYPNRELVIVDDGEQDLSPLVAGFPEDQITYLKLDKKPENCLGYLRNVALDAASGEFITQWDDDDWYHPERIRAQAEVLLKGYDMCCLSSTLVHIDTDSFFYHPFVSFFRRGVPGSIMHRRDRSITYPEWPLREDTVFLNEWLKRRHFKLPESCAYLFIRCYHGRNSWDKRHFLARIRSSTPDWLSYLWHSSVKGNVFQHRRFRLDEKSSAAFRIFLENSKAVGLFPDRA